MNKYSKFLLIFVTCLVINLWGSINVFGANLSTFSAPIHSIFSLGSSDNHPNFHQSNSFLISQNSQKQETKTKEKEKENKNKNKSSNQTVVSNTGYPVILGDETLFSLSMPIANISAEVRAKRASEAIKKFAEDHSLEPQSLQINEISDKVVLLSTKDIMIATFAERDALSTNLTLEQLATEHQQKIITAVEKYRQQRNWKRMLIRSLGAIVVTVIFVALIKFIGIIHRWIEKKLEANQRTFLKILRFKVYN